MPMNFENIDDRVISDALKHYLESASNGDLEEDKISIAIQKALSETADLTISVLKPQIPQMLADNRANRIGFEARLYARWRAAFDLYEAIWIFAEEAGGDFITKNRPTNTENNGITYISFNVLTHLHARACHIAAEIYSLLRSGQATGAMARWRSLHEVSIVMYLVREYGDDLAQRYIDHEVVESIKAYNDYEKYRERLGYEPEDPEILKTYMKRQEELCQLYGISFKNEYGWASKALGKTKPNIRDLEEAIKLDHLRPFYRLASHGIHANPKGITFELEKPLPDTTLIVGGSNAGLADPGQSALISLGQCTISLLTYRPDIESTMTATVIQFFIREACQLFIDVHREILKEETLLRSESNAESL